MCTRFFQHKLRVRNVLISGNEYQAVKYMADAQKIGFKEQILNNFSALITAAFGLVAALAWNGFIVALFKQIFGSAGALLPMLIYAVVVTVIAVIATIGVAFATERVKDKKK